MTRLNRWGPRWLLALGSFVLFAGLAGAPARAAPHSPTASAPTRFVEVDGQRIAYRRIGQGGGAPLLLLNRFRGTMDHWDPQLVDRIMDFGMVLSWVYDMRMIHYHQ